MAHQAQKDFFIKVKEKFPQHFKGVNVIDFGSRNINGSLKELFEVSNYIGIDIHEGDNVDIVCRAKDFTAVHEIDTVVSASMLEHDEDWLESLLNMYKQLKKGGLMVVSAAGPGFQEHGTARTYGQEWGPNPNYYKNIDYAMLLGFFFQINPSQLYFEYGNQGYDTYFYLIK